MELRQDILRTLQREFGIVPQVLRSEDDRVRYADSLIAEALLNRRPARSPGYRQ